MMQNASYLKPIISSVLNERKCNESVAKKEVQRIGCISLGKCNESVENKESAMNRLQKITYPRIY